MPDLMLEFTAVLIVAVVALWASFAFFLGPALWKTKRWVFYLCIVIGVGYGWFLTRFLASGWLGKPENATTVQAVAAAAQAIFAVALIVLTVLTVRANAKIAEETSVMARETEKMAAAAVQQQRAATRPVLVFRLHPVESGRGNVANAERFGIEVFNVGAGPALDTRVFITGPFRYFEPTDHIQPLVIAPEEAPMFTFKLDEYSPFVDVANPMRWPRPEDAQLIQEWEEGGADGVWTSSVSPEHVRHREVQQEVRKRRVQYLKDLTSLIADQRDVGQIGAEYRDLAGVDHASSADLLLGPRPKGDEGEGLEGLILNPILPHIRPAFIPNWPPITLGPLLLASPLTGTVESKSSVVAKSLDAEA